MRFVSLTPTGHNAAFLAKRRGGKPIVAEFCHVNPDIPPTPDEIVALVMLFCSDGNHMQAKWCHLGFVSRSETNGGISTYRGIVEVKAEFGMTLWDDVNRNVSEETGKTMGLIMVSSDTKEIMDAVFP